MASSSSNILVESLSDDWTTQLRQDDFPGTNHKFSGRDGRQYRWKWYSTFSLGNDLQVGVSRSRTEFAFSGSLTWPKCINDQNELIAVYRCSTMALRKDGELIIFPVRSLSCFLSHPISRTPYGALFLYCIALGTVC
jgi:hypothetical protein